jgi:teichuronic acid exporter
LSTLKQRSTKAFAWDLIGKFSNQGISFIISIFLARLLAPEDFGMLAMVNVVIGLAAVLVDMGLGSALIQRQNLKEEHYGSVFYFNIAVGTTLFLLFFLSAGLVAKFYERPDLKPIMKVMSLNFIISSFCNVQRTWLRKQLKYSVLTKAGIWAMANGGITGVTLAFLNFGVWALVAQSLVSGITNNIYVYFFTGWKPRLLLRKEALKNLWGFGFNMFLSGLLDTIYRQLDSLIIGKLFSPATLGQYFRAKSLNQFVINYTSGSLMSVLFPVLSSIQNEDERYKNVISRSFHLLNFATFFLLGFLFLTAKDIIVILFSDKWLPSVEYFRIIVLAGFVYPFSALLVNIISSKGNSRAFLKLEIWKKVFIGLNFIIGFWFGLKGFLYGMIIAYAIALHLNIIFAAKEMKVNKRWFYQIIYKYLLLVIFTAGGLRFLEQLVWMPESLWLHGIIYGLTFVGLYAGIARILQLKGLIIVSEEVKKMDIREIVRRKLMRKN